MTAFTFSDPDVLVTTSPTVSGREVETYHGVVVADVTPGRNIGKDLAAGLRDVVGGRSKSWENTLEEHQRLAIEELLAEAKSLGANAVIGLHVEDESIGGAGMMNVKAVGTAVTLAD